MEIWWVIPIVLSSLAVGFVVSNMLWMRHEKARRKRAELTPSPYGDRYGLADATVAKYQSNSTSHRVYAPRDPHGRVLYLTTDKREALKMIFDPGDTITEHDVWIEDVAAGARG